MSAGLTIETVYTVSSAIVPGSLWSWEPPCQMSLRRSTLTASANSWLSRPSALVNLVICSRSPRLIYTVRPMSWECLPSELQVFIVSKLPFSDLLSCRRVNRRMRDLVDQNKRILAKRTLSLVRLSCEEDLQLFVWNKDLRKRKILTETVEPRARRINKNGMALPLPNSMTTSLSRMTREATIKTLEFYEIVLTEQFLSRLSEALPEKTVDTIQISMSSFRELRPEAFLRFLNHLKPINLRLSWIRHVSDNFFDCNGLLKFLETKESLELVNITNCHGKQVHIPLDIGELIRNNCYSFHLDKSCSITQQDINNLVEIMSKREHPHHVRLACDHRPPPSPKETTIQIVSDQMGFSAKRLKKLWKL